ncbi:hypothetical protein QQZ08_004167 [Neonectria magnoliae]|uniref:Sulfatase N-terminal domain-containing protein n=1 Tax=Neonectria magnoliae TaxID=2732573 RepID=A0ABR1I7B7_9HYPO
MDFGADEKASFNNREESPFEEGFPEEPLGVGEKSPEFLTMSVITLHSEDGEYVDKLPDGWYSSDGYGNKMLEYPQDWKEGGDERPFFAYIYKAYTTEGGVRVPFLVKPPASLAQHGGTITHQFATVMDLAPTIPYLEGSQPRIHAEDFINGWETCGRAACRRGDWKIVFIPKPKGPERWQLYNLAADPGEVHDLAEREPERLRKLVKLWDQYVLETGVVALSPELRRWMASLEEQISENTWIEYEYWQEGAREYSAKFTKKIPRFERRVTTM